MKTTATKPTTDNDAGTDVEALIDDLDGGVFARKLSLALSKVGASVSDNDREGEVTIKLTFSKIPGTSQVQCKHKLQFTRPTPDGKVSEEEVRTTPFHVGKYGRLSLAPESQMSFLDKKSGEIKQ